MLVIKKSSNWIPKQPGSLNKKKNVLYGFAYMHIFLNGIAFDGKLQLYNTDAHEA